jgi:hypothetical protein
MFTALFDGVLASRDQFAYPLLAVGAAMRGGDVVRRAPFAGSIRHKDTTGRGRSRIPD